MAANCDIRVKRIYEAPAPDDGKRVLVDRLWPRGVSKSAAALALWARDASPSNELRREFHHDPDRWKEFQARYFAELDGRPDSWRAIAGLARLGPVTLLYAARDATHNNAIALRNYLLKRLMGRAPKNARRPVRRAAVRARRKTS